MTYGEKGQYGCSSVSLLKQATSQAQKLRGLNLGVSQSPSETHLRVSFAVGHCGWWVTSEDVRGDKLQRRGDDLWTTANTKTESKNRPEQRDPTQPDTDYTGYHHNEIL